MKIIHIAGFSNTGKTTFIRELVPELEKRGLTGVVKHIGHHGHSLPEGKDTTLFHEAGAAASAGIDAQKSVLILKETDLERILAMFCDAGVQYAVIEGFKEKPYPKVVIGNIANATNVLLTNPSVEEVLSHLGEFSDMVTREGFFREIEAGCDPGRAIQVSATPMTIPGDQITSLERESGTLVRDLHEVSIRFASTTTPGARTLLTGICAPDARTAIEAATRINSLMLSPLPGYKE
ncbi:MAG TPA: molybdopterin-guanine dinucleotide biosynthesis protein B [Methanoregulaceae archaeon]|nr:molybdopterin-guanine dinucleotide biosynthesis protein B [Methanoregulaceae archaeon]HPW10852.1 molybdopterin-guanine dinucleotide biosynthesis protein B [Methanoregulaceae archaeon]